MWRSLGLEPLAGSWSRSLPAASMFESQPSNGPHAVPTSTRCSSTSNPFPAPRSAGVPSDIRGDDAVDVLMMNMDIGRMRPDEVVLRKGDGLGLLENDNDNTSSGQGKGIRSKKPRFIVFSASILQMITNQPSK